MQNTESGASAKAAPGIFISRATLDEATTALEARLENICVMRAKGIELFGEESPVVRVWSKSLVATAAALDELRVRGVVSEAT